MVPPTSPNSSPLAQPVIALRGIGPERSELLKRLGILTVEDLLLHRPRRYEDRRRLRSIKALPLGELAIARGAIVALGVKWYRHRTKSIFELVLDDGTARLHCRWWNSPFMENNFETGQELVVCGKLKDLKPRTMEHPETEIVESGEEASIHMNRITPIYPLTEGISQRWLRGLIYRTLGQYEAEIPEPSMPSPHLEVANGVERSLAASFPSRREAIRNLHFPEDLAVTERARRRLAFDEFVALQRQIQARRRNFETKSRALPCRGDNRLIKPFLSRLGFRLTEAQTSVLRELRADMSATHPMRRLLQGDVGSGKTVVAGCCALMGLESGYDAALMAPTEILAEQHFATFSKWFGPLGIEVRLLTGNHRAGGFEPAASMSEVRMPSGAATHELPGASGFPPTPLSSHVAAPGDGRTPLDMSLRTDQAPPTLFIGTHALIQSSFAPQKLGLVIIDEQHRFGVAQREKLVRKGPYPHLLVMTATPIPRTLGLTLYGELDVSVIDSPPPGRGKVSTFVRPPDRLPQVWAFIKKQLDSGRQAYVVYPRIEETTQDGPKSVIAELGKVERVMKPHRVGMLHGGLKREEKERVMTAFHANQIKVLVATSLIEVGVDVANATVMLIGDAEQFGLAQLHQLRGRIGRGAQDSYCILVAAAKSKEAQQRLRVLEETNDGFRIAEADLKLRGPGELLGQQQSGLPQFSFGDLVNDLDLIKYARDVARHLEALPTKAL